MIKWLLSLFQKQILIVEVEKPRPSQELSQSAQESLQTLGSHPAFQYLLAKLKLQRSMLETKLRNERHASLTEVEFIQSGIFWSRWLEDQVSKAVFKVPQLPTTVPISDEELNAFKQLQASISSVGE